jgi:hypothetical protein
MEQRIRGHFSEAQCLVIILERENSLYAIEKYSTCALCHWKLEFELYAICCIFWCALCHFWWHIAHQKNTFNGIKHIKKCKKWHKVHQKIQRMAENSNSNFQWHRAHELQFFVVKTAKISKPSVSPETTSAPPPTTPSSCTPILPSPPRTPRPSHPSVAAVHHLVDVPIMLHSHWRGGGHHEIPPELGHGTAWTLRDPTRARSQPAQPLRCSIPLRPDTAGEELFVVSSTQLVHILSSSICHRNCPPCVKRWSFRH